MVAKPPDEVQRSFSMPQIEVTTRRGRERPQPPSPAKKRRNNNCQRPARAPHLGARSPAARPHRVRPHLLAISAAKTAIPPSRRGWLGRIRGVRRNSLRNSEGPSDTSSPAAFLRPWGNARTRAAKHAAKPRFRCISKPDKPDNPANSSSYS